jgi:hypothetical protein
MAPIKLDEHTKEKLEQRRLQPSSESWSQLANRLDTEERSKNKKVFWWLGIAASIALIISVSVPFLTTDSKKAQPVIVDIKSNSNKEETVTKKEHSLKITTKEQKAVVAIKPIEEKNNPKNTTPKSTLNKVQKDLVKNTINIKNVASTTSNESLKNNVNQTQILTPEIKDFEALKIQGVVAEIQKLKDSQSGVTDREVDSLLKMAHKELLTQRIYDETSKTVDANALLQDVEADLEQSFRTKVFEALKTNYGKVKTAVAERNN